MTLTRIALLACLTALLSLKGNSQSDQSQSNQATCAAQGTCGDCIATANCTWCSTNSFSGTRCLLRGLNTTCAEANTENPTGRVLRRDAAADLTQNPVSITNVNLELRVGDPVTFQVQVTPLRNLPLDLYVLIDLSASMSDELSAFKAVAGQIGDEISDLTSNVRLGFGSFNEKFTRPYTRRLLSDDNYAFFHRITLTNDTTTYNDTVQEVRTTSNADNPENGLEGLAQVLTCEDVIGWRDRTASGPDRGLTRVVLFMTDDAFHYSGEGQLAGILTPYNGRCLIDKPPDCGAANFTRWNEFDYPSVGQIVDLLAEKEVVTIFAVQENRLTTYENLVNLINQKFRASFSTLESNANAILELINREYRRILQAVSLQPSSTGNSDLDFKIRATCPPNADSIQNGEACDNVELDSSVTFDVTVTLQSCDAFQNGGSRTRSIASPSFGEFTITYEGICNCQCEDDAVVNSPDCNNRGNFTCGVCECNPGFCGPSCEFVIGNRSASDCPRAGIEEEICSGPERGVCDCFCRCVTPSIPGQMITGDACQCDNFRCNLDENGQVCSGRGQCCNSVCMCETSELGNIYHGTDCQCEPEVEICVDPNGPTGVMCSNRGMCGCSSCVNCDPGFSGQYCEIPSNELQCDFNDHQTCIAACHMTQMSPDQCNTSAACTVARTPTILFRDADKIETFDNVDERNQYILDEVNTALMRTESNMFVRVVRECAFTPQESQCMYMYYIVTDMIDNLALVVERPIECNRSNGFQLGIPPYALALIILAILLILGILILVLIKVLFLILDYAEYRRWKRESDKADFSKNLNPLYQSPEMKYENVAYGKE